MSWMGCYERRDEKAKFIPSDDRATKVVWPKNAFMPDIYGGHGIPSVTGERHDQVAREAAGWFKQLVEELSEGSGEIPIAAVKIGSAGKYKFWREPNGVRSAAECLKLGAEMVAAEEAEKAAREAASNKRVLDKIVQGLNAALDYAAENKGGVVVDYVDPDVIPVKYGCLMGDVTSKWRTGTVLLEDGTVLYASYNAAFAALESREAKSVAYCLKAAE